MQNKYRGLICKQGSVPIVAYLTDDKVREVVDGYLETVPLLQGNNEILVICNEEGKLNGLPPNFPIHGDTIVGDVCIVKVQAGEMIDMMADEATDITEYILAIQYPLQS